MTQIEIYVEAKPHNNFYRRNIQKSKTLAAWLEIYFEIMIKCASRHVIYSFYGKAIFLAAN